MKKWTAAIAAAVVVALWAGVMAMTLATGTTAQDRDAERISMLETRVAEQYEFVLNFSASIGPMLLPPPDENATWDGGTFSVADGAKWVMYCRPSGADVGPTYDRYTPLVCFRTPKLIIR